MFLRIEKKNRYKLSCNKFTNSRKQKRCCIYQTCTFLNVHHHDTLNAYKASPLQKTNFLFSPYKAYIFVCKRILVTHRRCNTDRQAGSRTNGQTSRKRETASILTRPFKQIQLCEMKKIIENYLWKIKRNIYVVCIVYQWIWSWPISSEYRWSRCCLVRKNYGMNYACWNICVNDGVEEKNKNDYK